MMNVIEEYRKMTLDAIAKKSARIASMLGDDGHPDLADALAAAAARLAANTDQVFWTRNRPKGNSVASANMLAESLLLEEMRAAGLSDESLDPVRDAMDA